MISVLGRTRPRVLRGAVIITLLGVSTGLWTTLLLWRKPNVEYLKEKPPQDTGTGWNPSSKAALMKNDLSVAELMPRSNSFFMVETAGKKRFSRKVLCTLESAAKYNQNQSIYMVLTSPVLEWSQDMLLLFRKYQNIKIRHLNVENFVLDSPLAPLWQDNRIQESHYLASHLSDVLRFLLLHRFGGTYLDSDQVILRELPIEPNFIGRESKWLAAGVLRFQHGHPIMESILQELRAAFDGRVFNSNGPMLVSTVVQRQCATAKMKPIKWIRPRDCFGIVIFEPNSFYPLHWTRWQELFAEDNQTAESVLREIKVKRPYAVHIWGKESANVHIPLNSTSAYAKLAKEHCPIVSSRYLGT